MRNSLFTALVSATMLLSSCSIIDEDLDDCGINNKIVYRLKLITNIQTELDQQLGSADERPVANALRQSLNGIFTDMAHDIDLSFYNTDNIREKHEQHIMNASQAEYVVYLPERDYRNLAVANITNATNVTLESDDNTPTTMKLLQQQGDTIDSHTTGMFTARKTIEVCNCTESFNVELYMANSRAALVVDTAGVGIRGMKVLTQDFATSFAVSDSTYAYQANPLIRSVEVPTNGQPYTCHYAVSFPSRHTRSDGLFRIKAYVTLPDGTTTENIITVEQPLLAGYLKIIKMKMKPNGSLTPLSQDVGVSVTLNWKQGGTYEPEV